MIKTGRLHQEPSELVEGLFDEFSEQFRLQTSPDPELYLARCPAPHKQQLRSLINTLTLTDRALSSLREALGGSASANAPDVRSEREPVGSRSGSTRR